MLPPLRERKEDVSALAQFFMQRFSMESKKNFTEFAGGVWKRSMFTIGRETCASWRTLSKEPWFSANLQLFKSKIYLQGLLSGERKRDSRSTPVSYHESVDEYRREVIVSALAQTQGNRAAAARLLGLQRSYLLRLMKAFDIS